MRRIDAHTVSTGAMADIAFLLLVFFFVATQIQDEYGIQVTLPRFDAVMARSSTPVYHIHINRHNKILAGKEETTLDHLEEVIHHAVTNGWKNSSPAKHVISLHCDRETSYDMYFNVHKIIRSTYHRIWEEMAVNQYGTVFRELNSDQRNAIQTSMPLILSE
jgi:biopolymer transport protein ExbD